MTTPMKIAPLLLLFLLIATYSEIATAKKHFHIINQLEEGRNLILHCRSRDNDLGIVMLADGHEASWNFRVNWFHTTYFYCKVKWQGSNGWLQFAAYDTDRDLHRCSDCKWMIAKNGYLYGYEPSCGEWKLYPLLKSIPSGLSLKDSRALTIRTDP